MPEHTNAVFGCQATSLIVGPQHVRLLERKAPTCASPLGWRGYVSLAGGALRSRVGADSPSLVPEGSGS